MPSRKKNGRFLKNCQAETYNNRLDNISRPDLSTTDFDTPSTLDFDTTFTPDFDTTFTPDFDTSFTPCTPGSFQHDHTYQSSASFDEINEFYFSGKLKPIGYTRHVIDIQTFFDNMRCSRCDITLKLKDGIGILPAGLCGHLIVRCYNCNDFVRVAMGKTHNASHGPRIFDVNTKLATGMYHSGIGPIQLNNLFTSLNLPNVSESLIRRRCEEVGPILENIAQQSVDNALFEEGLLTKTCNLQADNDSDAIHAIASGSETATSSSGIASTDNTNPVCGPISVTGITASADGAYQRRGSGRCYNSLSGTASMIGKKTGKVVGYSARYKRCRKCDVAKFKKRLPTKHKCRKNWCGSAKSMEPDMIVEILKDAKKKDTPVITLIGDDDCTAFNRARCEVDSCLEKVSDINHVKKNISNRLHKIKGKYKELSVKTITALIKSFSFMLAQNKGDSDRIKNSLPSVVLHQFGNHDGCGDWCQMKNKPTAKHRNLPWGADLKDENLKKDLLKVFTDLDPGKMSKLDSSNPNESFNNTVRSKAPKDKHYSESGSLAHRLSAAVCQKNEGYKYVAQLQRLKLKSQRSSETRSHEIREGDTYCSNVIADAEEPDLTVIPGPSEDNCEHIEKVVVFYDLETTGLSRQSSITQISAVCEEQEFNRYATPTQEISEDACRVTGLKFNTATNELLYNDEAVSHKHPQQVLLDFIQFLMSLCASDKHIVLAAHNNRRFDSIILFNQLKFYKLWNHFSRYIVGFCDTLPFFKMLYPEFENYKQEYIAQKLLNEAYSAHNALDDCRMLMSLVKKTEKIDVLLSDYFYSSHQVTFQGVQPNKESLEHLLRSKVLSRTIFKKLEDSTLTYNHLKISYHRDGFDGLFYLLSEKTGSGKARISNNRRVIQKIADFFSNEE
ncbi:uncharacterized protein LOC143081077 [Mytilus galloprovincialis]|uniref:uncharacterized protein LOC143081077 n=1 Tax=Mytilus galloprovincialis TaxID=29158 RepID=UPI003F7C46F0